MGLRVRANRMNTVTQITTLYNPRHNISVLEADGLQRNMGSTEEHISLEYLAYLKLVRSFGFRFCLNKYVSKFSSKC